METRTIVTKGIGWTLALMVPAWALLLLAYLAERSFGGHWVQFGAALVLGALLIGARRIWSAMLLSYADQQRGSTETLSAAPSENSSTPPVSPEAMPAPVSETVQPAVESNQTVQRPLRALWKAEWMMWLCGMVVGLFCFGLVFFGFFHPLNQLPMPWRALVLIATLDVALTLGYLLGFLWQRRHLVRL